MDQEKKITNCIDCLFLEKEHSLLEFSLFSCSIFGNIAETRENCPKFILQMGDEMITYEKSCWPSTGLPFEIYLKVKRNNEDIGRIVMRKEEVSYKRLEIIVKTADQVEDYLNIIRNAWKMKMMQDTKGWGSK